MDKNQGYAILKAVMLENGRGFALGEHPTAPSRYVTWACYDDKDGQRQYEWGHYGNDRAAMEQDFADRPLSLCSKPSDVYTVILLSAMALPSHTAARRIFSRGVPQLWSNSSLYSMASKLNESASYTRMLIGFSLTCSS